MRPDTRKYARREPDPPGDAPDWVLQQKLEESLEESFPASDPPSWTPLARIGTPRRPADRKERHEKRYKKQTAHQQSEPTMSKLLSHGTRAPQFTLPVTPDQDLSLADLQGRAVILAFYPADWSPVCGDQVTLYNEILSEFHERHAELLGISVDGAWCHQAFAKDRRLHFPLLSDFEPKGAVARAYGAYRQDEGVSERALFVIDRKGVIFWSYRSPIAVNPGADGILDALDRLAQKESHDAKSSSHAA
jgi:peroxiredoxin